MRRDPVVVELRVLRVVQVPGGSVRGERANFTRLVNGCIEAKFCNKICVGKLSPRSTRCTYASLGEKNRIENEIMKMYTNKKYSTEKAE